MIYIILITSGICLLALILGFVLGQRTSQAVKEKNLENLIQKLIQDNTRVSHENISLILKPFGDNIDKFQKKVEDSYLEETKQREALKTEVIHITDINKKMTEETQKLTQALKGDVKTQGSWGELILEKILEASGLKEGDNFILQGKGLDIKDEQNRLQKPDLVVLLPDKKELVVDSKVSLTAYERYFSSSDDTEKKSFRKDFLKSLEAHISSLSEKAYHQSEKLNSPDFTMMFVPVEGAFHLALEEDPHFFIKAVERSIIPVSPTTLLATLKTVASLWRFAEQNKNSQKIALEAGRLYDKFALFIESLDDVKSHLGKAEKSCEEALSRLKTGSGSVMDKISNLKELGARTKKDLRNEEDL